MGFQLTWDYADVIVRSLPAYDRTSEFYRNITDNAFGTTGIRVPNFIILYGAFRFVIYVLAPVSAEDLPPGGHEEFVKEFAKVMLRLTATVVIGTYRVLAFSARVSIWITMAIVDNGDEPALISVPI